ncbi:hypothetical protein [Pseudomonas sp. DSP3-2-2]|uniref:hypothetical protein n=1 Tax=unclassified Pseudomonas TaxID=196821 RepID=UPI003CF5CA10
MRRLRAAILASSKAAQTRLPAPAADYFQRICSHVNDKYLVYCLTQHQQIERKKPGFDWAFYCLPLFECALATAPSPIKATTEGCFMHASFQERFDELGALLTLTHAARAAAHLRIGRPAPARRVRYQVVTKAPQAFHIVEIATGKTRACRFTYVEALDFAMQLEAKANRLSLRLVGAA